MLPAVFRITTSVAYYQRLFKNEKITNSVGSNFLLNQLELQASQTTCKIVGKKRTIVEVELQASVITPEMDINGKLI